MTKKEKKPSLFDYADGKHKALSYTGCVLAVISTAIGVLPFLCIWKIVKEIFLKIPDIISVTGIEVYGYWAVIFIGLSILIYVLGLLCTHFSAFSIATNMREKAMAKLMKLPLGYFQNQGSGRIRRVVDDSASQTETFLAHNLPDMAGAYAMPFIVVALLLVFDWRLGLVSLIPTVLTLIMMAVFMSKSGAKMGKYMGALEDMNNHAVEYVRGIPVVKTFQQSIYSFKRFKDSISNYKTWVVDYSNSTRMMMTVYSVLISSTFIFLISTCILLMVPGAGNVDLMTNFVFYALFSPLCALMLNRILWGSNGYIMAQDALTRIESIMNEEPLVEAKDPKVPAGDSMEFSDVTFTYPGNTEPALKNVSFRAEQGTVTALVGPSGSGKSTAAALIPRFWDVGEGSVAIGGVDVRDVEYRELAKHISFVFQNNNLFKDTLRENVRAAKPDATDEEVMAALKTAHCDDIVARLPDGLDTVVGKKGVFFSGGEVQRIALARAVLKDSPVIVLDEATAFADPDNEYMIQKAMSGLVKDKTVIMIAHRLPTIRNADNIIVLDNGSIAEQGKHDDLMAKNGLYAKMWNEYDRSLGWKVGA